MSKKLFYFACLALVLSLVGDASADLVAHWRFDETSGTTAFDSSGNGLNGTLNGDPQWVAGKIGGALEFDGDDFVDCGNADMFNFGTNDFTITAWIKTTQTDRGTIFANGGDNSGGVRYTLATHESNDDRMTLTTDDNSTKVQAEGATKVIDGQWYHVAAMREGTTTKVYVNGVLDGTNTVPEGYDLSGTSQFNALIGAISDARDSSGETREKFYVGIIDDVRLYNEALLEPELLSVMEGTLWPYAFGPTPADGALYQDTWVDLSWRAGDFAVSHDIYFGENFDAVKLGTGGTFLGNLTWTQLRVGAPGFPYPNGLFLETTYYWRIDEVQEDGTIHTGDVWSFTTARAGGGLQGKYYQWSGNFPPTQSAAFSNLVMTRVDPTINFNWGHSAPGPSVNTDNFSVRWTGKVEAAFTETYTFYTTTDDGVRLWVNGQRIINKWREQVATEWSGTIDLVAGQMYDIVMEMYENRGDAVAQLRWPSLRTPKQLIPQAALFHPIVVGVIELTDALDTDLNFTTGGSADWFSQTLRWYHDGDAVQSGEIKDDQETWMQTTVSGAGTVSFFWKVSSEGNYDCLEFYIDGTLKKDKISGTEDWHEMTCEITGSGSHTLEWRYSKDGSMSMGHDCGWVDYVEWVPAP